MSLIIEALKYFNKQNAQEREKIIKEAEKVALSLNISYNDAIIIVTNRRQNVEGDKK